MSSRSMHGRSAGAWLAATMLLLSSCGSGGVTANRIEDALAPTFANLIQLQRSILGLPDVDASALRASASCHKLGQGMDVSGGGNWTCTIVWFLPGHRGPLRDAYDLSVTMDGCYTATSEGAEGHLGGPTITMQDGTPTTNLLYVFDGCFDPT
jgi:hypothetical protein